MGRRRRGQRTLIRRARHGLVGGKTAPHGVVEHVVARRRVHCGRGQELVQRERHGLFLGHRGIHVVNVGIVRERDGVDLRVLHQLVAHRDLAGLEALKRQLVILVGVARGNLLIRHGFDGQSRLPHMAAAIGQLDAIARALALARRIPNGLGAVDHRIAGAMGKGRVEVARRRNVRARLAHDGVQVAVVVAMGLLAIGVGSFGNRRPRRHRVQRLEVGVRVNGRECVVACRAAGYALVHIGRIIGVAIQVDERRGTGHAGLHLVELQFHVHQIAVFPHGGGNHHVARGGDQIVGEQRLQRRAGAGDLTVGHKRHGLAIRRRALQGRGILRVIVDGDGLQVGYVRRIQQRRRQQHLGGVEAELVLQARRARHRTGRAPGHQIAQCQLRARIHRVGGVVGDDGAEAGVLLPEITHRVRADLHRAGGVVVMQRGRHIALLFHLGIGIVHHHRADRRQGHAQNTGVVEDVAPTVLALEGGQRGRQRHIDVAVVTCAEELHEGTRVGVDVLIDKGVGHVQAHEIPAAPGRLVHGDAVGVGGDGRRRRSRSVVALAREETSVAGDNVRIEPCYAPGSRSPGNAHRLIGRDGGHLIGRKAEHLRHGAHGKRHGLKLRLGRIVDVVVVQRDLLVGHAGGEHRTREVQLLGMEVHQLVRKRRIGAGVGLAIDGVNVQLGAVAHGVVGVVAQVHAVAAAGLTPNDPLIGGKCRSARARSTRSRRILEALHQRLAVGGRELGIERRAMASRHHPVGLVPADERVVLMGRKGNRKRDVIDDVVGAPVEFHESARACRHIAVETRVIDGHLRQVTAAPSRLVDVDLAVHHGHTRRQGTRRHACGQGNAQRVRHSRQLRFAEAAGLAIGLGGIGVVVVVQIERRQGTGLESRLGNNQRVGLEVVQPSAVGVGRHIAQFELDTGHKGLRPAVLQRDAPAGAVHGVVGHLGRIGRARLRVHRAARQQAARGRAGTMSVAERLHAHHGIGLVALARERPRAIGRGVPFFFGVMGAEGGAHVRLHVVVHAAVNVHVGIVGVVLPRVSSGYARLEPAHVQREVREVAAVPGRAVHDDEALGRKRHRRVGRRTVLGRSDVVAADGDRLRKPQRRAIGHREVLRTRRIEQTRGQRQALGDERLALVGLRARGRERLVGNAPVGVLDGSPIGIAANGGAEENVGVANHEGGVVRDHQTETAARLVVVGAGLVLGERRRRIAGIGGVLHAGNGNGGLNRGLLHVQGNGAARRLVLVAEHRVPLLIGRRKRARDADVVQGGGRAVHLDVHIGIIANAARVVDVFEVDGEIGEDALVPGARIDDIVAVIAHRKNALHLARFRIGHGLQLAEGAGDRMLFHHIGGLGVLAGLRVGRRQGTRAIVERNGVNASVAQDVLGDADAGGGEPIGIRAGDVAGGEHRRLHHRLGLIADLPAETSTLAVEQHLLNARRRRGGRAVLQRLATEGIDAEASERRCGINGAVEGGRGKRRVLSGRRIGSRAHVPRAQTSRKTRVVSVGLAGNQQVAVDLDVRLQIEARGRASLVRRIEGALLHDTDVAREIVARLDDAGNGIDRGRGTPGGRASAHGLHLGRQARVARGAAQAEQRVIRRALVARVLVVAFHQLGRAQGNPARVASVVADFELNDRTIDVDGIVGHRVVEGAEPVGVGFHVDKARLIELRRWVFAHGLVVVFPGLLRGGLGLLDGALLDVNLDVLQAEEVGQRVVDERTGGGHARGGAVQRHIALGVELIEHIGARCAEVAVRRLVEQ